MWILLFLAKKSVYLHHKSISDTMKLCCIGHITRDKIVTPQQTVYMSGGVAFYFAYAVNHLPKDLDFTLVTKVADEDRKAAEDMMAAGIDVRLYPSRETVFFENIYGENPDDRDQRVRAKSDQFCIEETADVDAEIYHLGTLLADDFSLDFVRELRKRGRISVDAQGFLRKVVDETVENCDWEHKKEWFKNIDIIKVNEKEMEVLTGETDARKAASILASWGPSEVLVTLGSLGSLILADGEYISIPSFKPEAVVDTTGCGDTYMAGYLYQRTKGAKPADAGRFAAAMCTLKLSHNGPFDGSIEDINKMLG